MATARTKMLAKCAFVGFLVLTVSGCMNTKVLELRDVQNFRASPNEDATELTISGLAFHSALAVDRAETSVIGNDLIVEIYLVRARPGLSGSFSETISLEPNVLRVLFGTERQEIWKRH